VAQQELNVKNQAISEANERLEEQAAQVEAAYIQQVHLNELKDQFLLNVNHELRTPLTAVYGYLELLREYHERMDSSMQTSLINQAVHGCEELQLLVSNVLDTLRGDISEKAPILVNLFHCYGNAGGDRALRTTEKAGLSLSPGYT